MKQLQDIENEFLKSEEEVERNHVDTTNEEEKNWNEKRNIFGKIL